MVRSATFFVSVDFLFQGYDNRARQGLDLGTPQGALHKRYIVSYNFLFKKFFLKNFLNISCVGQFFCLFSASSDTFPWVGCD